MAEHKTGCAVLSELPNHGGACGCPICLGECTCGAEKSHDEKINALVNNMENWDLATLLSWAQDIRRNLLKCTNPDDVDEEYRSEVEGK